MWRAWKFCHKIHTGLFDGSSCDFQNYVTSWTICHRRHTHSPLTCGPLWHAGLGCSYCWKLYHIHHIKLGHRPHKAPIQHPLLHYHYSKYPNILSSGTSSGSVLCQGKMFITDDTQNVLSTIQNINKLVAWVYIFLKNPYLSQSHFKIPQNFSPKFQKKLRKIGKKIGKNTKIKDTEHRIGKNCIF